MKAKMILIALGLGLVLTSCVSDPRGLIVGKWQKVDGPDTVEFFQNGTVTIKGTAGLFKKAGTGTYKFIEGSRLKLELEGAAIEVKISVSKEELALTDPEGNILKYRSIKWFA